MLYSVYLPYLTIYCWFSPVIVLYWAELLKMPVQMRSFSERRIASIKSRRNNGPMVKGAMKSNWTSNHAKVSIPWDVWVPKKVKKTAHLMPVKFGLKLCNHVFMLAKQTKTIPWTRIFSGLHNPFMVQSIVHCRDAKFELRYTKDRVPTDNHCKCWKVRSGVSAQPTPSSPCMLTVNRESKGLEGKVSRTTLKGTW